MRLTRVLASSVLAAALMVASGCGSDGGKAADTPTAPDKVNYLTSFGTFGRDAYVYLAMEKGFFTAENIEIAVKPGTATGENLKLLSSGQADFAPCDFTGTLIQVGKEKLPVTAVAAIHQRSLAAVMALEGSGITTPKDLEGKKMGDQAGGTTQLMFPTYARLAGFDHTKVTQVNIAPPQLPANLASGSVNVIGQFVVGKPTIEAAAGGRKVVVLPYSDYLTDLYGNALVTSTKLAREKPQLVQRFTRALMKGLEASINNPDEAAAALKKHVPTANEKAAAAELTLMAAYVRSSSSGVSVGAFDSQRVARSIAIMQGAGAVPAGLTPEQLVSFDLVPKS